MKQKQLILGVILAMSIAIPAFAHEGEDDNTIVGVRASTTINIDHKGKGLAGVLQKIEDRKDSRETEDVNEDDRGEHASTTLRNHVKDVMEKLHDEHGGFLGNIADMRVKHVSKLFQATINRFEKLITRFESRIAKIKAAGGNTTAAEASVTLAKSDVASAKADLVTFSAFHFGKGTTTASSTDAVTFETAKNLALKIRNELRAAKDDLMKALKAIIEVQKTVKIEEHSTTTATSTNH
jgi:hypothetical protein